MPGGTLDIGRLAPIFVLLIEIHIVERLSSFNLLPDHELHRTYLIRHYLVRHKWSRDFCLIIRI